MANRVQQPMPGFASAPSRSGLWARYVNAALGVWLFISAFAWPHTQASGTNTWIVGALIAICALWAIRSPSVRWANTVLAIWLLLSTFFIEHVTAATVWNNAIVAIVVFLLSLVPNTVGGQRTMGGPRREARSIP